MALPDANGDGEANGDVERRILLRVNVGDVGDICELWVLRGGGVAAGTLTFATLAKFSISARQVTLKHSFNRQTRMQIQNDAWLSG